MSSLKVSYPKRSATMNQGEGFSCNCSRCHGKERDCVYCLRRKSNTLPDLQEDIVQELSSLPFPSDNSSPTKRSSLTEIFCVGEDKYEFYQDSEMQLLRQENDNGGINDKEMDMSFAKWSLRDLNAWTCPSCTYVVLNPLHLSCEMCGQERGDNKPNHTASSSSSPIPRTTLEEDFEESGDKSDRRKEKREASLQLDLMGKKNEKVTKAHEKAIEDERLREIFEVQKDLIDEAKSEREVLLNRVKNEKIEIQNRAAALISAQKKLWEMKTGQAQTTPSRDPSCPSSYGEVSPVHESEVSVTIATKHRQHSELAERAINDYLRDEKNVSYEEGTRQLQRLETIHTHLKSERDMMEKEHSQKRLVVVNTDVDQAEEFDNRFLADDVRSKRHSTFERGYNSRQINATTEQWESQQEILRQWKEQWDAQEKLLRVLRNQQQARLELEEKKMREMGPMRSRGA